MPKQLEKDARVPVAVKPLNPWATGALAVGLAALLAGALLLDSPVVSTERARVEATVVAAAPGIPGRVATLAVEPGAGVKRGQVVATLEAGELEDEVTRSAAAVAAAEAGLPASRLAATLQITQRVAAEGQAVAALAAAQADLAGERANAERAESAAVALRAGRGKGVVSSQELVTAEAEARAAEARAGAAAGRVKAAEVALTLARRQARLGTVEGAGTVRGVAEVRLAQAVLALARRRHAQATITAPADGVVARKLVAEGDQVMAGQPIYTVLTAAPPWVQAEVRELDAPHVRPGAKAEVTFDAWPDRRFTGHVDRLGVVAELADAVTGRTAPTVALTIKLDAPLPAPGTLLPGMTARARIERVGLAPWGGLATPRP
jgi:membrane fusion protein (multidrug efflux system)